MLARYTKPLDVSNSHISLSSSLNTESNSKIFKKPKSIVQRTSNAFFKSQGFASHHLGSYANLVQNTIPELVMETVPFDHENENYRFQYHYENVYFHKPGIIEHDGTVSEIYPNECRLRSLTYAAPLFVRTIKRFTRKLTGKTVESVENVFFGLFPVMVYSVLCRLHGASVERKVKEGGECEYEQGGHFIIKGAEKVLMGMERMATDQVYVFPNKHDPLDLYAEISSLEERSRRAPSQFYIHIMPSNTLGKRSLRAYISYFKKEFPIGILFKALGISKGIKDMIYKQFLFNRLNARQKKELDELIDGIEEESFHIEGTSEAFTSLAKIASTQISNKDKAKVYVSAVLEKEFLPRLGIDETAHKNKIRFLVYMVQKLLMVFFGLRAHDDHDHERNKRSDESGVLLATIFRQSWGKVNRELQFLIRKKMDSGSDFKDIVLGQLTNNLTLSKDLQYALASGNWSAIRNSRMKTGVSQILNRFNYQATISHLRRTINPMPKNSVLSKPRQLHGSMWGLMCPYESPEGASIGLVKNKALTCTVSVGFSDIWITELIHAQELSEELDEDHTWYIFINGKLQGFDTSDKIYKFIHDLKLSGTLPIFTSVYSERRNREIYIWTDSGRKCRPVFIVRNILYRFLKDSLLPELCEVVNDYAGRCFLEVAMTEEWLTELEAGRKTWNCALREGLIEMIDASEQENLLICSKIEDLNRDGVPYTHAELNDAFIIGACASIIPFANSDPAARITYQSSMTKQSVSLPTTNFPKRMDTMNHILWYPQKPLCQTQQMEPMNFNELPAGQNCVVALVTNGGANMEDAVILNQDSADRGLFRESFYRTYKETESRVTGQEEYFARPPNEPSAHKLGLDGIVRAGIRVADDDMLIGKVSNAVDSEGKPYKPSHTFVRHGEHGIVDMVLLTQNPDGSHTAKVQVRQDRPIEVGDKLAATHSQKGVVGLFRPAIDMPFTSEGIIPDVLINPHSTPSRMTIGHLKEIVASKYAGVSGQFIDATIFGSTGAENDRLQGEISEGLKALGYQENGWETMYDGTTGEMMKAKIFVGACYYQRLKHMVADKIHARGMRGPIESLTHQPTAGRAREGGSRLGEMERDCLISLGAAFTIQEKLRNLSDKYKLPICLDKNCGLIAIANPEKKIYICKACKKSRVGWLWVPYSLKLLIVQLMAAGLALRVETNDVKDGDELELKSQDFSHLANFIKK